MSSEELTAGLLTWAGRVAAGEAQLLAYIGEFDDRHAWSGTGILSCAHWLSWQLGYGLKTAMERVRVARALRALPLTYAELHAGRLSYSQVRAITRVATPKDEAMYLRIAANATGDQLDRIVRGVRRARHLEEVNQPGYIQPPVLTTRYNEDGSMSISIRVPAEDGAVILAALRAAQADLRDTAASSRSGGIFRGRIRQPARTRRSNGARHRHGFSRGRIRQHRRRRRTAADGPPLPATSSQHPSRPGQTRPHPAHRQHRPALRLGPPPRRRTPPTRHPRHSIPAAHRPRSAPSPARTSRRRRRPHAPRTLPSPPRPARHPRRRTLPPSPAAPAAAICTPTTSAGGPDGGPTDLDNLVLLCSQPPHPIHDGELHLTLNPATRTLHVHTAAPAPPSRSDPHPPWRPVAELDPTNTIDPTTLPPPPRQTRPPLRRHGAAPRRRLENGPVDQPSNASAGNSPDPMSPDVSARARDALLAANFTVQGVTDAIGPVNGGALGRGQLHGTDLDGVSDEPLAALIRLFLLGERIPSLPAKLGADLPATWFTTTNEGIAAQFEVRPYGLDEPGADSDWFVVSDLGLDARPGPLPVDHVPGIGGASLTLAGATVRPAVGSALDLGTGCGIQALHLAQHVDHVTGSDRNPRALRFAAASAALSGMAIPRLVEGNLLDPFQGERFDLIVSNPPFVIGAHRQYTYRDSGLPGDDVAARLVQQAPDHLNDGGYCQLLANWIHHRDEDWRDRVADWFAGTGCDAWVVQREVSDPAAYVSLWLADSADSKGGGELADEWRRSLEADGIEGIGFGLITLRRREAGQTAPLLQIEEIKHPIQQPLGPHIQGWFERLAWLAGHDAQAIGNASLSLAENTHLETMSRIGRRRLAAVSPRAGAGKRIPASGRIGRGGPGPGRGMRQRGAGATRRRPSRGRFRGRAPPRPSRLCGHLFRTDFWCRTRHRCQFREQLSDRVRPAR